MALIEGEPWASMRALRDVGALMARRDHRGLSKLVDMGFASCVRLVDTRYVFRLTKAGRDLSACRIWPVYG